MTCDVCHGLLPDDPEEAYVLTDPMPARLACEPCAIAPPDNDSSRAAEP